MNNTIHADAFAYKIRHPRRIGDHYPRYHILAMKLTILLTIVFSVHVSTAAIAQRVSLQVKNASLKTVLQELRRQSGYAFIYNDNDLNAAKPVTVNVKEKELLQVLPDLFIDQPLTYVIDDMVISIIPKPTQENTKLFKIAQQTIRGRVTDTLGNPLEGVVVEVIETGRQAITDANGVFALEGVIASQTLNFRLLGYQSFQTTADRSVINAVLKIVYSELDEVYVTVNTGYQNIPKERATGSFEYIDNDLLNRRVGQDIISRLEGVAPGLVLNRSSASEQPTVTIRGRSTIFANATPLIVVDNFPYNGDINDINPNDIESVTVLKDAAAASIWGVRATNGVIVITTKKGGQYQSPKVEFNTNITVGEKPDMFYIPVMTTSDFIDYERLLFNNGYYVNQETNVQKRALSPVVELLIAHRDGLLTNEAMEQQIAEMSNVDVRKEFNKHYLQRSINQQYALSINGGGEKSSYYFSGGFDKNKHAYIGNENRRFTLSGAHSFTILNKLQLSSSLNFIHSDGGRNNSELGDFTNLTTKKYYPYARLADESGQHLSIMYDWRSPYKEEMENLGFLNWQYYPLNELALSNNFTKNDHVRINLGADYPFMEDFELSVRYQYETQRISSNQQYDVDSYFTRNLINRYSQLTVDGISRPIPIGGISDETTSDLVDNSFRAQLNYQKSIEAKHHLFVLAGYEVKELIAKTKESRLYGYDPSTATSLLMDYETRYSLHPYSSGTVPYPRTHDILTDRFRSFYANASYSFIDKYIVSASGRIDQSNYFGVQSNQRSVPLWSAGIAWELSKEDFFHLQGVDQIKLRATYGYNGNIDKSLTAYTTASYLTDNLTGQRAANIINPANPRLQWEKVKMINLGIDFQLFERRIHGSIEYFYKRGYDIIGNAPFEPTTGITSYRGNLANMKGKGWDVVLITNNLRGPVQWNTTLLFSNATDKVTTYRFQNSTAYGYIQSGATGGNPFEGKPVLSIFSYKWAGLDPENGDPMGYINGEVSKDYVQYLLASPEGNLVYNGPVQPTIFGALRNEFHYKDFSLSFNVTYKFGHYFRSPSINYYALGTYWKGHKDFAARWQQPGDELTTNVPSIPENVTNPYNLYREQYFYLNSEILVEKADHIRLQDIGFSYTIDSKPEQNLFRRAKLYAYLNNIGLLWKANDKGIDPDAIPDYGASFLLLPRTIALGIKIEF